MTTPQAADLITLPQGGGSVRGIGETFSPELQTGTGNFSIPLAVPAGRRGLRPALTLAYSTGNGNGMFGLGWAVGLPGISRRTARGVPTYDDQRDTFILAGNEDLVPVEQLPGSGLRYRPRTESLFARIIHWRDPAAGQNFWEVTTRDGMLSRYGTQRPAGAGPGWRDPATVTDPDRPDRIFAWKLTSTSDPLGNRIEYEYAEDAGQHDNHRWRQPMLRTIRYADHDTGAGVRYLATVTFDDEPREDAFSSYTAGFELRTSRRYRSITTAVHPGQSQLVKRYEFDYQPDPHTGTSLLSGVALVGFDEQGGEHRDLPQLRLRYSGLDLAGRRFQPVTGADLPSGGLGGDGVELIDVTGDGLPDILQCNGSVRYWRNLGDGGFDRPRTMDHAPAGYNLQDPGVQLLDADGDGRPDLLVTTATSSGYFPLRPGPRWGPFRPHRQPPTVSLKDPRVTLIDLNGDGITDALYDGPELLFFINDEHTGWSGPRPVIFTGADRPPPLSFADARVRWADLTGDGLTDLVLVHPGGVDYWPNLGHGRFGDRLRMPATPWLAAEYDPQLLRLGDVDGDGLADAVYAGADGVTVWFNRGGNRWSTPVHVRGVPASGWDLRITDLLGSGTGGVLFSRETGPANLYFLDLTGGVKPRLLSEVDNQLGAVTRIQYRACTAYARADQARPATRWRTTLPVVVPVVSTVRVRDEITGSQLTTTYTYRHGYWDGVEREFRGFGRVEQTDAQHGSPAGADSPPALTRTWFHLGPVDLDDDEQWRPLDLAGEYWAGDPGVLDHGGPARFLTGLSGAGTGAGAGATTAQTRRARRDALRALRGRVLRTELYGLDGSAAQDRPYTVTEHAYDLRAEAAGVYFAVESARRTTQWERGDDPMSAFDFTGDHDAHGQPRRQSTVAAPRRSARRAQLDAAVIGTFEPDPTSMLATHTRTAYAQSPPQGWLHDRVAEIRRYEPAGPVPVPESTPHHVQAVLADQSQAAVALRDAFDQLTDVRLIGHVLHHYDGPAYAGLAVGELGQHGLLTRSETLVFPDPAIQQGYGGQTPSYLGGTQALPAGAPAGFGADLGYRHEPAGQHHTAGWYADTVRNAHDVQLSTAARPLPGRGLVLGVQDPLGREVQLTPDPYWLLPAQLRDAAGLRTTAVHDYRTGQPNRTVDPNGHTTTYRYHPLGLLTTVMITGRDGTGGTDERPQTRYDYDLTAYPERGQPASVHTTRRVWHASDGHSDEVVQSREYFDGLGRSIQTRTHADELAFGADGTDAGLLGGGLPIPGQAASTVTGTPLADRVVVSGWSVRDNKGRVVEHYEPFFASGFAFQPRSQSPQGQRVSTTYDPRGRVVLVRNPDGSQRRTVFGVPADLADPDSVVPSPWTITEYDENDLAPASGPLSAAVAAQLRLLPVTRVLDGLGRDVCRVARGGQSSSTWHAQRRTYDISGNALRIVDELGRIAFDTVYDLTGRPMRVDSIDAGRRITVLDAAGLPVHTQDGRGCLTLRTYDAAGRPVGVHGRDSATAALTLRERLTYGDALAAGPERDAAVAAHAMGRVWTRDDEAGRVQLGGYDLAGQPTEQTRQVISDAAIAAGWTPDWAAAGADTALDPAPLHTSTRYDALGRVVSVTTPAGATLTWTYGRSGALRSVAVDGVPYLGMVLRTARGQRVLVEHGNGLITRYAYDPATLRLSRLRTERASAQQHADGTRTWSCSGAPLQDLTYGHDLVGNVTRIDERTPGCGVAGTADGRDALTRLFGYDGFGRLVSATGRACADLGQAMALRDTARCGAYGAPYTPAPAAPGQANAPDLTALYEQSYTYDPAGNLLDLWHRPTSGTATSGWHRRFGLDGQAPQDWAAATSNRLTSVQDGSAPAVAFGYDEAGNLDSEHTARTHTWDHAGRLVGLRVGAGAGTSVLARYLYAADGALVKKWVRKGNTAALDESTVSIGGHTEQHRWAKTGGGTHHLVHVLDGATRAAVIRTGPAHPDDAGPPIRWEFGDHLASTSLTVDGSGAWINREEYLPYGDTSFGGYRRKRFRFTGHELDADLGTYRMGSRHLLPGLARWTSCDPAGPVDGPNLYAYVRNNPLRFADPTGTQAADAGQPPQPAANAAAQPPLPPELPDAAKPVEIDIGKLAKEKPQDFADITRRATAAYSRKELVRGEELVTSPRADGKGVDAEVTYDYSMGKPVTLEHSGRQSVVQFHCTDFVYNVFHKAGGDPPHSGDFWMPTKNVLAGLDALQKQGLVERVPTPADDPKTSGDESTANVRPGDIAVWDPGPDQDFGHHLLIVGTNPDGKASTLKVNEAGTVVRSNNTRPVFPPKRDSAVYRLTKFDANRTAQLYANDPDFRQAFNEAFHSGLRLDLPQFRAYLK